MPNRLADETSPYLLQHKDNPVDWYPWGDAAFARARAEDRPILLSVGYSACHWCHVMAHESFEDGAIAALMNQHFVNVKVDREERPDVDEVYMNAVQLMSQHGGWPMTVFLTPAGEPFFGGTYYPPVDRHGMPSFRTVLQALADAWRQEREQVLDNARQVVEQVRQMGDVKGGAGALDLELLDAATARLMAGFDPRAGGFGGAPKFPQSMGLSLCLRRWRASGDEEALRVVRFSLERMAAGGIRDHLGGGFARYSVDADWLVPHFEKMLYDNALLARLYLETWQATGDPAHRRVAEEVLGWIADDMTDPGGAFYSARDADSEGVEGKFYVWTPDQLAEVLGGDADRFARVYDVTAAGNFEGSNILHLERPIAERAPELGLGEAELETWLDGARERLLAARARREPPLRDDKIVVAWNGLMLSTMAFAARVLDSEAYREAAVRAGEFLWRSARTDGRLRHMNTAGVARGEAFLDDVAGLGVAYVELYQATFDGLWLERALELARQVVAEFEDSEDGGFYYTPAGAEELIARSKNPYDNAVPGGNSLATHLLLRLSALTGDRDLAASAERALVCFSDLVQRAPQGFAHMAEALDGYLRGMTQVLISGDPEAPATRALVAAASSSYDPNRVIALDPADGSAPKALSELTAGKGMVDGEPAAWVCRAFACERPVTDADELAAMLGRD